VSTCDHSYIEIGRPKESVGVRGLHRSQNALRMGTRNLGGLSVGNTSDSMNGTLSGVPDITLCVL
jgi:hypothetical protein